MSEKKDRIDLKLDCPRLPQSAKIGCAGSQTAALNRDELLFCKPKNVSGSKAPIPIEDDSDQKKRTACPARSSSLTYRGRQTLRKTS